MKLSVAMCTYNGEKYIKRQLETILQQTITIDEIIICDDGSNDKTTQIIEEIQLNYPNKISIFKNEVRLGSNKNFEKAISICSGDYIFLSDQDDIWKENKAEEILTCFKQNPSVECVFTNADLIDEKGKIIAKNTLWDSVFFLENQLPKPIDLFCLISSKRNMVTGATLCFKKEITNLILPIPDIKKYYHDEWIAIIIASRNKLHYLTDRLIFYRMHATQQIGGKSSVQKNAVQKHLKFSNYVLGNTFPKSFSDLNQLTKIYYRNYLKFKMVANYLNEDFHLNFNSITKSNLELFIKHNNSLKKVNPVLYIFKNILDKMRGKRRQ